MNKIKGVIFDLDGVLCSTDTYHFIAWKNLAKRLGLRIDESLKDKVRGISRMASLDIVLGEKSSSFTVEEKQKLADEKNTDYRRMLSNMNLADRSEGAFEVISFLKKKGIKIAVGSASCNAPLILNKIGLRQQFDVVVDGSMISHSKPHPEVFQKAADFLHLSPGQCLVIEDAYMGIEAAARGGFVPVAIGTDASKHEKAVFKIKNLLEIENIIPLDIKFRF
ncbi:beta-phosphoglucomutase [Treponema sp. OMZ 840]|uniref:beta-phosphoglucomutase n=1 Tax=Treponema sp. OMZ 840 TaxID=244313 RepID=UPI003D94C307